ncbi:MAG: hypothetical protein DI547_04980 [Sphingobium sp.]|nr:MAG: hypothetical protein DI547_04980 [Sphingobium sp.]
MKLSTRTLWTYGLSAVVLAGGLVLFFRATDMDIMVPAKIYDASVSMELTTGEKVPDPALVLRQQVAIAGGMLFSIIGAMGLVAALICHAVEARR